MSVINPKNTKEYDVNRVGSLEDTRIPVTHRASMKPTESIHDILSNSIMEIFKQGFTYFNIYFI